MSKYRNIKKGKAIERSFAEAKQNHGLRFARMLGLQNMYEQSFLTAAVQNMKRLAKACFFPFSFLSMMKALISLFEIRAFVDGLGLYIDFRSIDSYNM